MGAFCSEMEELPCFCCGMLIGGGRATAFRVVERGRVKCGQYWPLDVGRSEEHGHFVVRNVHIEMFQDFKLSHLELCDSRVSSRRMFVCALWPATETRSDLTGQLGVSVCQGVGPIIHMELG